MTSKKDDRSHQLVGNLSPLGEKGAVFLEFGISLVTIGIFVAGIIISGSALRQASVAADAARHASRSGAAKAYDFPSYCTESEFKGLCSSVSSTPGSLNESVALLGCGYLQSLGFPGTDWKISVSSTAPVSEDPSFSARLLKVSVDKANSTITGSCAYCWQNLFANVAVGADSIFLIELDC